MDAKNQRLGRATIDDVAAKAGVSIKTVSRVVNGSGPVSPKLRARVEKALKETGYVPNSVARNLRTKRTDTIGLVMPDITNPFFTHVVRGMEVAAREAGAAVVFVDCSEQAARAITAAVASANLKVLIVIATQDVAGSRL